MTPAAAPSPLAHRALLYNSVDELVDVLTPIVESQLGASQPVIAILDERAVDGLRRRLGATADGVEFQPSERLCRYPAQALGYYLHSAGQRAGDGSRLTMIGLPQLGHDTLDDELWVRVEAAANVALADHPMDMICGYRSDGLAPSIADGIRRAHPELQSGAERYPSPDYQEPGEYLAHHPLPAPPALHGFSDELAFGPAELASIRRLVADRGRQARLPGGRREDLVLAVNELVTSSVSRDPRPSTLRLRIDPDAVICEVSDAGSLDDPFVGLLPPSPQNRTRKALWMVRQLCETVHVWTDRQGTHVRARMLVRPS